jgi:TIR domain
MPDCFISYSSKDQQKADFIHSELTRHGLNVFMASVSLPPGTHWSPQVLSNLQQSPWVIFLASKAACSSVYVQQELGVALGANKKLIPIVWDIPLSDLPG